MLFRNENFRKTKMLQFKEDEKYRLKYDTPHKSVKEISDEINNDYYMDIKLKDTRPEIQAHAAPEDYGLTRADAIKARLRYLKPLLKKEQCVFDLCQHALLNKYDEWTEQQLVESGKQLDMIRGKIMSETNRLRHPGVARKSYDIEAIKKIPIDTLVEVNSAGFFKVRNEKTASCKWYRDDNVFVDFGGDNKRHDVIDLFCILNNCTTTEAMRELSNLI